MTRAMKRLRLQLTFVVFCLVIYLFSRNARYINPNLNKIEPLSENLGEIPDCDEILAGNRSHILYWSTINKSVKSELNLIEEFSDCTSFKKKKGYPIAPNSKMEALFPVAFSISAHKEIEQLERLLRMLYWPQNWYCIHVDLKSDYIIHQAVNALASCFDNVIITNSEYVYWGGFGVLKAALNCAHDLTKYGRKWKYLMTLASQDFPLKTNREMVAILQLLNQTNDVEMERELDFSRYFYRHIIIDKNGTPVTHVPNYQSNKLPVPYGLKIYKGNFAAALSDSFVRFILNEPKIMNFIEWLKDTDTSDEHLWSTVNHNSNLKAPGGYKSECHNTRKPKQWITRFVNWRQNNESCAGTFVRDVCVFGVGDIQNLHIMPHLFANKFYLNYQTTAFECMEKWHFWKTRNNIENINIEYYNNLDAVKQKRKEKCLKETHLTPEYNIVSQIEERKL